MKKLLSAALAAALIVSLGACSNDAPTSSQSPSQASQNSESSTGNQLKFPEKDITFVVPFDAGGGNDILARVVSKVAKENGYFNGVNIIIENQPGGGGAIGQAYVANTAAKDGYTWLAFTASVVTNPILKEVPFAVDDFKIVNCCNADPVIMLARPDAPFDDMAGLIEYAKANKLIVNDSGFGTSTHIRTLDWTSKLEAQGTKINFESTHANSGSIQIAELMGGHADVTCLTVGECADAILDGSVKAIGLMAEERYEGLPDVPTFKEMGYDGWIDGADRAVAVSADIPDDVYNYLVTEMDRLCGSPEFIKAMKEVNLNPANRSPEDYQEFIDTKTALVTSLKDFLLSK